MVNQKKILHVFILLAQLAFFGCSKGNDDNGLSAQDQFQSQPQYLDTTSEQAKHTAMNAQVSCGSANPADCSPAVGMLVSYTAPKSVGQCTAFLVGPQIVLTNSHCIPDDLKTAGSSCSDRIWIYFPELGDLPPLRAGCAQILEASTLPQVVKATPDYAVIRLDQPIHRTPLILNRSGFKDQDEYQIVKIDPQSTTSAIGAMTRATCKAKHNSIVVQDSGDDRSLNMALGDCQIVHGNSGSPLLDSEGQVRGVIQIKFEESLLGMALLKLSTPLLDDSVGTLSAGTNFACLNLPAEVPSGSALAPECASASSNTDSKTDSSKAETHALTLRLGQELEKELTQFSGELNPAFQWSLANYDHTGALPGTTIHSSIQRMIPVPACIKDSKLLLNGHHHWVFGYASKAKISMTLPEVDVKIGVNRYLVPDYRLVEPKALISATLNYSPASVHEKNSSQFKLEEKDLFGLSQTLFDQTLGLCGNAQ